MPAGSLPSCSELDPSELRPDTPASSVAEDVDWNDVSSLDELMSRLEALDRHVSRVDSHVSLLAHDSSCVHSDISSALRLIRALVSCCCCCYYYVCLTAFFSRTTFPPFPQIDIIEAMVIFWKARGKLFRSVLCSIVCNNCTQ